MKKISFVFAIAMVGIAQHLPSRGLADAGGYRTLNAQHEDAMTTS